MVNVTSWEKPSRSPNELRTLSAGGVAWRLNTPRAPGDGGRGAGA
jgi:hypothetical protein